MIEILKFEMINRDKLVARFNVKMHKWGGLIIKDCSFFEVGDKKWINLPSRQYEADGKKKYSAHICYEDHKMNDAFKGAIMKAVEEYISKTSVQKVEVRDNFEDVPF